MEGTTDEGANDSSSNPCIDAAGGFVGFESHAGDLIAGFSDANNGSGNGSGNGPAPDVYVRDISGGSTELVSESTALAGQGGDGGSFNPTLSPDGSQVAYDSLATDLVPADINGVADVFLRQVGGSDNERISLAQGLSDPDGASTRPSLGTTRACFESLATSLPGLNIDTNDVSDVYRVDL